jgi:hypothetical protein
MDRFTAQLNRLFAVMFDSRRRDVKAEDADVYVRILVQV